MAKKVFIAKLSFSVTVDELKSVLSAIGPVTDVAIPLDRETRRPRGFAFATFTNDADADRAIASLNGTDIAGRPIVISEAQERESRPPSPGGSRYGGRRN